MPPTGPRPRARLRSLPQPEAMGRIGTAVGLLRAGRAAEARDLLRALVAAEPDFPPAREVLGAALELLDDLAGAEREFRAAAALDPRDPAFPAGLGQILARQGRLAEAEAAWRAALAIAPASPSALERLAFLLLATGRPAEAEALLAPQVGAAGAAPALLRLHADALRALDRPAEAADAVRRWIAAEPANAEAEAWLSGLLESLGDLEGALAAARSGVLKGPEDPDAWTLFGRLLEAQHETQEAEAAYRRAVDLRPNHQDAHLALADLIWMRTGAADAALAPVSAALARTRGVSLLALKVKLMGRLGQAEAAYRLAAEAAASGPDLAGLQAAAAGAAAAAERGPDMLRHAEALHGLEPDEPRSRRLLAEACVRLGQFDRALPLLDDLALDPADQHAIAVRAIVWRCLGDPRYREVCDYERMVRVFTLDPPAPWTSLKAYLADLARSLRALHRNEAHPLDQSLRGGTQTSHDLSLSADPAIRGFFTAVRAPIARYIEGLGTGGDPLRVRIGRGFRFAGAWSVNLRPQGFHVSHVHPEGWISSAFYVEAPEAVRGEGREGWLQFGDPGVRMAGRPGPDHFVRPEPGQLVLFPSYLFHGTRPFGGAEPRLTIAFDVLPK